MSTVAQIAARAFTAVAASLPDAVHAGVLSDGATDYACRVVEDYKNPGGGFPKRYGIDGARVAYVEGAAAAPEAGWSLTYAGAERLVLWPSDVAAAGGLYAVYVVPRAAWLNVTVDFRRAARTKTDKGEFSEVWASIPGAPTQAAVVAQAIGEQAVFGRVVERGVKVLMLPYFAGLTTADAVTFGGVEHNIRAVDNIEERGVWLRVEVAAGEQL